MVDQAQDCLAGAAAGPAPRGGAMVLADAALVTIIRLYNHLPQYS